VGLAPSWWGELLRETFLRGEPSGSSRGQQAAGNSAQLRPLLGPLQTTSPAWRCWPSCFAFRRNPERLVGPAASGVGEADWRGAWRHAVLCVLSALRSLVLVSGVLNIITRHTPLRTACGSGTCRAAPGDPHVAELGNGVPHVSSFLYPATTKSLEIPALLKLKQRASYAIGIHQAKSSHTHGSPARRGRTRLARCVRSCC